MWEGRRVNAKPYDLIVEEFSFYAPILSHFSNRPTVTILQSRHGLKALRYHPAYGWLSLLSQYCVVRRKRAVILASEHLRPLIHPSARVAVIGQGADIPKDLPSPTEEYVLFLGRFDVRIKGLDILLKAWAKLPPNLSSMPLHLAGSGDEEGIHTLMRETGARNVHLVGRLDHSEAMAAIRRAAFICVPSRDEGSPLVVYEAFALGKPVIGSSIPALKPLIPDGIAGIQVPPGDPQALSKAIESLLVDRAMRSRLAEGALRVGKEYSWERVAERQEKFYWETIEGR
jgi:phosphatidylinositol alpha-mannosyltransferase